MKSDKIDRRKLIHRVLYVILWILVLSSFIKFGEDDPFVRNQRILTLESQIIDLEQKLTMQETQIQELKTLLGTVEGNSLDKLVAGIANKTAHGTAKRRP